MLENIRHFTPKSIKAERKDNHRLAVHSKKSTMSRNFRTSRSRGIKRKAYSNSNKSKIDTPKVKYEKETNRRSPNSFRSRSKSRSKYEIDKEEGDTGNLWFAELEESKSKHKSNLGERKSKDYCKGNTQNYLDNKPSYLHEPLLHDYKGEAKRRCLLPDPPKSLLPTPIISNIEMPRDYRYDNLCCDPRDQRYSLSHNMNCHKEDYYSLPRPSSHVAPVIVDYNHCLDESSPQHSGISHNGRYDDNRCSNSPDQFIYNFNSNSNYDINNSPHIWEEPTENYSVSNHSYMPNNIEQLAALLTNNNVQSKQLVENRINKKVAMIDSLLQQSSSEFKWILTPLDAPFRQILSPTNIDLSKCHKADPRIAHML